MLNVLRLHQEDLTDVDMHQIHNQKDGLSVIFHGIDGCVEDLEIEHYYYYDYYYFKQIQHFRG